MIELFRGVGVALVTLFEESGGVAAAATGALAGELAGRGMQAVLACGTTGEAQVLSDAERAEIIEAVRSAVPPGLPVLAGTGAATTQRAVELTAGAVAAGADAVLAWPPPGCTDLQEYFAAIAAAAGQHAVLAYHIPWVSAPGVPVAELENLPVAGVKDSSGDPDRLLDEIVHYPGAIYVGSSALLALAGPTGATGAILALANLEPERCGAAFAGDGSAQLGLAETHLAVRRGGPPALKRLLAAARGLPALSRSS